MMIIHVAMIDSHWSRTSAPVLGRGHTRPLMPADTFDTARLGAGETPGGREEPMMIHRQWKIHQTSQ